MGGIATILWSEECQSVSSYWGEKGRTDSTFVCSASWIHSNHAERVGPIVDGGIVGLRCLNGVHSRGSLAERTWDDLDRRHLEIDHEEGGDFSLKARSSARALAWACSPLGPNSAVRRSRESKHSTRVGCLEASEFKNIGRNRRRVMM
jgi:hypothetical protein